MRDFRPYELTAPYAPAGDQIEAIAALVEGLDSAERYQTLLGVTGSGKSFTVASVIAATGRSAVVLAPNKTLAAQLYQEMKAFFPHNRVEYFVSYYDYYQPEAYVPSSDTYIEKTSAVNAEIERMRHAATFAALQRRDTIIVASVSALYGLGDPERYREALFALRVGDTWDRDDLLTRLVGLRYVRNDTAPERGEFRARGDVVEIVPIDGSPRLQVTLDFDEVAAIAELDEDRNPRACDHVWLAPATHYAADADAVKAAVARIEAELGERLDVLQAAGKAVEAQRLAQRVRGDLDMLRETGWCAGVENYSYHLEGRQPGSRPWTLLDYLDEGFVLVVDESHVAVPQMRAARAGDASRKQTLVDYGFRLPSARDNRPLDLDEVWGLVEAKEGSVLFVSATPGLFEIEASSRVVDQIIRPTGLVDPDVVVRPRTGALRDVAAEARAAIAAGTRMLVVALTKRSAEELVVWLGEEQIAAEFMHADTPTLERIDLLARLRDGEFDVLVGVNLLREGLDLPEVSAVCVLDADVEGFLRSKTALLQIIGRAARNVAGHVVLYADEVTDAIDAALTETARRRMAQEAYNAAHGITPTSTRTARTRQAGARAAPTRPESTRPRSVRLPVRAGTAAASDGAGDTGETDFDAMTDAEIEAEMLRAAEELRFEDAAVWRDLLEERAAAGSA